MNCLNCQKPTNNPKFCSMSCAGSYNNKIHPKRKKTHVLRQPKLNLDITLEEAIYTKHGAPNAYSLVRQRARAKMKHVKQCSKCGYNKHVEVAHIKPINSYSRDTLVSIINADDNLLVLCPNCHWEFDHQ